MPRVKVDRPSGAVSESKREFALLQQLGDGTGEFDAQELKSIEKYGDKSKIQGLEGNIPFSKFADAFKQPPTKPELEGEGNCVGWCCKSEKEPLKSWKFPRRSAKPNDVVIQITYSGLCHSDVHQCRNEWGGSTYPMVPGHEIIGVVVEVGKDVKKFKVGEYAAVGCMVDSCLDCKYCKQGDEQYCAAGPIMTYNAKDKEGNALHGGYSSHILCQEHFVLRISRDMHEAATAPLLCAGITTYEPMKVYGVDKPNMNVGVVGLGGLGHMVVQFSKAFGQNCTVISRSYKKKDLAKELGANDMVATSDEDAVAKMSEKFDAIIDTVSAEHDINTLLGMLKVDGQLILVGAPDKPHKVGAFDVIGRRRRILGSFIGGIPRTQEMLDFCEEKKIRCMAEVIPMSDVNEAFDRMVDGDVKFRFVVDVLNSMVEG